MFILTYKSGPDIPLIMPSQIERGTILNETESIQMTKDVDVYYMRLHIALSSLGLLPHDPIRRFEVYPWKTEFHGKRIYYREYVDHKMRPQIQVRWDENEQETVYNQLSIVHSMGKNPAYLGSSRITTTDTSAKLVRTEFYNGNLQDFNSQKPIPPQEWERSIKLHTEGLIRFFELAVQHAA